MIDKLLGLYKTNKILFFILIIPVAIAFIYKLLMSNNLKQARIEVKQTEEKDKSIIKDQKKTKKKIDKLIDQIKDIENGIDDDDVDEDWHKKS